MTARRARGKDTGLLPAPARSLELLAAQACFSGHLVPSGQARVQGFRLSPHGACRSQTPVLARAVQSQSRVSKGASTRLLTWPWDSLLPDK